MAWSKLIKRCSNKANPYTHGLCKHCRAHFKSIPEGLTSCLANQLAEHLGAPALLYLKGKLEPPLFISVLLHGNEVSGWNGLRRLLCELQPLPRSVIIFIGNVDAAAAGLRTLPTQQDYNRIWREADEPEASIAREVQHALHQQQLFAAIDLHNNTGHNPHYSVLTDLAPMNLGLARMFSDKAVVVREPNTVLTRYFDGLCPAVTLELGPVGDDSCDERCYDYLKRCINLNHVPNADFQELSMFRTLARVHIAGNTEFSFADDGAATPLILTGGVEGVNFHQLPRGMEFGAGTGELTSLIRVLDVQHNDVTNNYFDYIDGKILLAKSVTPSMYTTDPLVIRQDCLCYFMEAMQQPESTP